MLLEDGEEALLLDEGDEALLLEDGDELLLEEGDELLGSLDPWPDDWDDDALPPCTPSAASVCWSSCPDALRLFFCWNCLIAASVLGPSCPSMEPTSNPLLCSACWASRTSELPCEDALLEEEVLSLEEPEVLPLIDDVPWPWVDDGSWLCAYFCDALADEAFADLLSLAIAAVLESARAAMTKGASFME